MSIGQLAHKLLLNLDPEKAHNLAKNGMRHKLFAPGIYNTLQRRLFRTHIDNPLGLAAGFDKNGELSDQAREYGFGWTEVGSITYHGGPGNAKPRLFRTEDGLINRMGLNGDPAEVVLSRLREKRYPYAINITKTHNPQITGDKAVEDIEKTYTLAKRELTEIRNRMGLASVIYTVLNISCPNTKEGKTFEEPESLNELLFAVHKVGKWNPLIVKFSPNLSYEKLKGLVEVADDRVDGYQLGNTLPMNNEKYGKGGGSGEYVRLHALFNTAKLREMTKKPILGCGGIRNGLDMKNMEEAGATAVLAYNGFVYGNPNSGPKFAHRVLGEYLELTRRAS